MLGDDVVIADRKVALVYEQTIQRLGVDISYQKSIISSTGASEFSKRFRIREFQVDLSPISTRALLGFSHPYGLMGIGQRYGSSVRFSTMCRIGGAGFRTLSRPQSHRAFRYERLWVMRTKSLYGGYLEMWIGRGQPLNPYLRGLLLSVVRQEMKPKDLRLIPDELFVTEKVKDFLEWSSLRSWFRNKPSGR